MILNDNRNKNRLIKSQHATATFILSYGIRVLAKGHQHTTVDVLVIVYYFNINKLCHQSSIILLFILLLFGYFLLLYQRRVTKQQKNTRKFDIKCYTCESKFSVFWHTNTTMKIQQQKMH